MTDNNTDHSETPTNVLEELVGPGKKFASVEDLAKSKKEADAFIDKLKEENQEARTALADALKKAEEGATVSDLLKEFRGSTSNSGDNQDLSEEHFQELVTKIVEKREAEKTKAARREESLNPVRQKVNGDQEAVDLFIAEKAKELGMPKESLLSLAETSPKAFTSLVLGASSTPPQGSTSGLPGRKNTGALNPSTEMEINGHKTKAWYDKQRAEMGTSRFLGDIRLQNQILKDRTALGDKFYGGT